MKKIILLILFVCVCFLAGAQSSRYRVSQLLKFGWKQRTIPNDEYKDSTFDAIWFKANDGNPTDFWKTSGNTFTNNASYIGTNSNNSFIIKTNNYQRLKIDSLGYFKLNINGFPSSGEPFDLTNEVNNLTLSGNNYSLRSSLNFSSTANNINYRIGALLGICDIKNGNIGDLGWAVGCYGVSYNSGSANVQRNIGGYFIGSAKGSSVTTNNYGIYAQTECSGTNQTTNNHGIFITQPLLSSGSINSNFGLYIANQSVGSSNYAIYSSGSSDNSYFAGNLTVNNNFLANSNATISSQLTCSNIIGGSSLTSSVLITASSNSASSGTGVGIRLNVGQGGTVTAINFLQNGNSLIPLNRSILGLDASGNAQTLINWSSGENLSILGKQGTSDISINPTNTSKGFIIKFNGSIGVYGVSSPSARLHIGAGAAASSSAPLKFTTSAAVLQSTPEQGAMEVNSSGTLFYTPSSSRYEIATVLTATASLDFPLTGANTSSDLTITVTGAASGDAVSIAVPNVSVPGSGTCYTAWVSNSNTVTIRFNNYDGGGQDPTAGTFKAIVFKN